VVAGRYRLISALGNGGMGTVWLAEDDLLSRQVAVKEVSPPADMTERERELLRERTLREARTAARLSHPNVVTIYDVVEDDGQPWIVMELVPARSLRDVVQAAGPLTAQQAAGVGLQILAALSAAHALGIMHRDVKPGNVLIDAGGRAILADFGIARTQDSTALTTSGVLVGSPSYIAPERARGERGGPESDLWSLGATLYALVEGRPAYDRAGPLPTLMAVVNEDPDPPSRAGALWPVIRGLLDHVPSRRLGPDEAERMLRQVAGTGGGSGTAILPALAQGPATTAGAGRTRPGSSLESAERTRTLRAWDPDPADGPSPDPVPVESAPAALPEEPDAHALLEEPDPHALPDEPDPAALPEEPDPAALLDEPDPAALPDEPDPHALPDEPDPAALPDEPDPHALPDEPDPAALPASPGLEGPTGLAGTASPLGAAGVAGSHGVAELPGATSHPDTPLRAEPEEAGPRRTPRERRRQLTWVLAAAAALILVTGVVVTIIVTGHPASLASANGHHPASSATPHASRPTATSAGPTTAPPSSPAPTPTSGSGALGPATIPAGYHEFRDSTGFSIAVPDGWRVSHQGHYVYLLPPSGADFLLIDQSDHPQPNPLADWQQQEANRESTYPGYRRIRLAATHYPQAEKAADWEFTYYHQGVLTRVLNRNVLANANHAYALFWSTPETQWSEGWQVFKVLARTFRPAPPSS
jgi:tRNA A-37 threonylcarbamoyl transferase component Bud32